MSYQRTFTGLIVKRLQYIEEATYGTTPTAAPTFISAGKIKRFNFTIDGAIQRYRTAGYRKVVDFLQTGQLYSFEIEYQPIDSALLKYGFNDPAGAGTIEKSLSFLFSKTIDGTENFYFLKGCKTDQITVEVTKEMVNVTQNFLCREVTTPVTTPDGGLSTPTYATNPTGAPWVGKNGGADPFTYNSVAQDTPRFNVSVGWNLDPGQPNGQTLIKFLDPTNKDCNVNFDVWQKDTTFIADLKSATPRAITFQLDATSNADINITNFVNESYELNEDADSNETTQEPASGGCEEINITSS